MAKLYGALCGLALLLLSLAGNAAASRCVYALPASPLRTCRGMATHGGEGGSPTTSAAGPARASAGTAPAIRTCSGAGIGRRAPGNQVRAGAAGRPLPPALPPSASGSAGSCYAGSCYTCSSMQGFTWPPAAAAALLPGSSPPPTPRLRPSTATALTRRAHPPACRCRLCRCLPAGCGSTLWSTQTMTATSCCPTS